MQRGARIETGLRIFVGAFAGVGQCGAHEFVAERLIGADLNLRWLTFSSPTTSLRAPIQKEHLDASAASVWLKTQDSAGAGRVGSHR